MAKTVVILGGSYAGLHVAHALLKKPANDVKVILVSKNSHFYWNIASVRAIVPGIVKDDEIFKPLASALSRYPSTSYELIIGTAESTDFDAKTVQVATTDGPKTLSYDHLVLATGSNCPTTDVPWKASGTYEDALAKLHETAEKVKSAERIVVAGAGATGIEVAGELGFQYGKTKEIVLLCGGPKLLGGDIVGPAAANELKKLKVDIQYDSQVQSVATRDGKTEISLANGKVVLADLYLPTMGLVPNSEYINAKYLVEGKKTVEVDESLRVKGATNVWAAGDIVSKPRAGFMITQKQASAVAKNIELALKGQQPVVAKGLPVDILACSTGRSRGAGRAGSFKLPSFFVWMAKGRTLALQMVPSYIDGSVA
ncbi:hypothetical protein B0T19DRAFT_236768 [Cercophora scortea]|uniref:FAD/NAD(P)-binding domain-containing protein n=1 Tax=Cercophora scortea TaxID=314031 RepID=A0AAE0IH97_9PEZI|nr:hypothetical protein B0T19DRAFT_236768 [Cercophora scortea]